MRIALTSFLSFLFGYCFGAVPLSHVLYNQDQGPSQPLLQVLEVFEIKHNGTWDDIVAQTQKKWLRKDGKERWDVEDMIHASPEMIYDLFSKLALVQPKYSSESHYEYAVILGATLQKVRSRFNFLSKEWKKGMRFNKLVILTGDRLLNPDFENQEALINPSLSPYPFRKDWSFSGQLPKNETEMMLLVLDQLDLPKEWQSKKPIIADAPQKKGKRPNTEDTVWEWLAKNPQPGSTLIVTDQPFLGRADTIVRKILPDFSIETVGEGVSFDYFKSEKKATPVILDELARWIYEVNLKNTVKSCTSAS